MVRRRSETIDAPVGNVAIVGRPNVGKSALFNRLVNRQIAIVHDQPGITRDRLSAVTTRARVPFTVWDTGGIAGAGEYDLAPEVRQAAEAAMHESDLILFLVDAQQGLTPMDEELARLLRRSRKPVVLVVNKIDHAKHEHLIADFAALGFETLVPVSAAHGRGIDELLKEIEARLPERNTTASEPELPAGIALAVVGKPNAGKSSLINAILNDTRTIVSPLPGTTRDAVDITYQRGRERFTFIDTAGIRARSKRSSSVEIFSVMRAERTIRRADLCILVLDVSAGVTSQDKKIAGLIQAARKPCLILLNKWDLVKPRQRGAEAIREHVANARANLFFLDYAPVLVASALTHENVERIFGLIARVKKASSVHIGTGILNRRLQGAFTTSPPPMVANKRLKLLYAAQAKPPTATRIPPPEFVLFVNDPRLMAETYGRYLEARIREEEPYPGLPLQLTLRAREKRA